jgi:hypothetical protein
MTRRASGIFDVKHQPQPAADSASGLGRMSLDRQFHGDLEGSIVVPDSGTEQLTGLTGTMTIDINGGKHFYTFEYQLPDGR